MAAATIEEPSIKLEFDPLDYSDVEEETENDDFFENLPEEVDYKTDEGIVLVERFELNTPDDLRFLINLEEKTLFPIYKKQQTFSPHERGMLTRLMVKNLLKHDIERIISRAKFEFYSKLITMVFTKEEAETYFHYAKGQVRGSLYNMYCKVRKEYKAVGILGKKRKVEDVPDKYERSSYESKKLGVLQDTVNFVTLKDQIKIQPIESTAVLEVGSSNQSNKRQREDFEENWPGDPKKTKDTEKETSIDQLEEEEYTISYIDESELQEQDSKLESDSGIVLIKNFQLETEEDLRFLVNLEEKTFIPIYEKNGTLSPYERGCLCRLIIKNLLKPDPEKIIPRHRLEFYSALICKLFPKESPEVYFKYMDRKSYGTLFNAYMRVKKEYKMAGIVKYKYKEYQEESQVLDKTLRAAELAELERNQRVQ